MGSLTWLHRFIEIKTCLQIKKQNMNQNAVEYVDLDLASSFSLIYSCGWPHLSSTRLCAEGVFSLCPLPRVHYADKALIEVLPAHRYRGTEQVSVSTLPLHTSQLVPDPPPHLALSTPASSSPPVGCNNRYNVMVPHQCKETGKTRGTVPTQENVLQMMI